LFFNQYDVETDETILPWQVYSNDDGVKTDDIAVGQNYRMTAGDQYFKFYLRKGAANYQYGRSFQKIDETLSYIGGLFGTLAIFLMFLNTYSKYCYELDFGDRIFQQKGGGSFGSQNFNFIVFIGYLFFLLLDKFGITLNWKTMRRYHQCRTECEKQLDMDLLLKKVAHFEEVSKVLLEDHHQQMLLMVPKPTITEAKLNRKKFLIKSIIYNQLEKKGGEVHVDEAAYQDKVMQFLEKDRIAEGNLDDFKDEENENGKTLKEIREAIADSYQKAKGDNEDDVLSRKILGRINVRNLAEGVLAIIELGKH
jgi:hypothetical protein